MGYVQVYKSMTGEWSVSCYECDVWLYAYRQWRHAQDNAVIHAQKHESKRCAHCGRS